MSGGRGALRAAVTLALLLVAGCASAADRFMEGMELEAEGRWREAALRYVEAMERDDTPEGTRIRLAVAVDSAVWYGVRDAERWRAAGDAQAAADRFLELDHLFARAGAVGFLPAPPAGFAQDRRAALDAAIDDLMAAARAAEARDDFGAGRAAYQRLRTRYLPDEGQRRDAWEGEAGLLAAWARTELDAGRYRAAWGRAAEILALEGPAPAAALEAAEAVQATAEARGTRRVAILPLTTRAVVGTMSPETTARQLADVLELRFWRSPPPLVAVADPVRVRQAVRRIGRGQPVVSDRDLAEVLGSLGGDFGVILEMGGLVLSERVDRTRTESARTRVGAPAEYRVERGRLTFEGVVEVEVVDARGRPVAEFTVRESASGAFERALYDGDPGQLDLDRSEARLFDERTQREAQQEVLDDLVDELAAALGPRVFERILSRIP